ncbi:MAG: flippase activity-associated protein Agl23 [Planctomycetota bacterium]
MLVLIAGGGLGLRLVRIEQRPMHTDEAVHAVKFNELWTTGRYVYDPVEYHGPVLYYATLPVVWLSGAENFTQTRETTYRVVPIIFGLGLILLLPLVSDGLGRGATLIAGVLTAVSPAFVFYSPYYIQEMLLAFFTLFVLAAAWRYVQTRRAVWALLAGAGLGLMHATKETCIIAFGCMVAALVATLVFRHSSSADRVDRVAHGFSRGEHESTERSCPPPLKRRATQWGVLGGAVAVGVAISVLFYTGFFTNARGPLDSILTYVNYFERAGNFGLHDHPWHYYLKLLAYTQLGPRAAWSEGLILLLAVLGLIAVGIRRPPPDANQDFLRFIAVYAVLMTLVYSAITYKTPWCLLQFLQPLILLAGVGAAALLHWIKPWPVRVATGLLLIVGVCHLSVQAWRTSDWYRINYQNAYVYAQPLSGVLRLSEWTHKLANVHPHGQKILIRVIADHPWPLPWYLRDLERVGYWDQVPKEVDAPLVIVSDEFQPAVAERLKQEYQVYHYGMRPDVTLFAYVEQSLWEVFVAHERAAETQPAKDLE